MARKFEPIKMPGHLLITKRFTVVLVQRNLSPASAKFPYSYFTFTGSAAEDRLLAGKMQRVLGSK
jgi:hypothetical protein